MKISVTPAGIEAATFRFLAQHLNQCATAAPKRICTHMKCVNTFRKGLQKRKNFRVIQGFRSVQHKWN